MTNTTMISSNEELLASVAAPPAAVLWRLSASLPDEERHRVRAWLASAERALRPPRRDTVPLGLTQRERVRRALLPRPNEFYAGDRDHLGQGAA